VSCAEGSRAGCRTPGGVYTRGEQRGRITSLDLLATLLLMQPRIWLAFWVMRPADTYGVSMAEPLSQDGRTWTCLQASRGSVPEDSKAALGTEFIKFSKAVDFFNLCFKKNSF